MEWGGGCARKETVQPTRSPRHRAGQVSLRDTSLLLLGRSWESEDKEAGSRKSLKGDEAGKGVQDPKGKQETSRQAPKAAGLF